MSIDVYDKARDRRSRLRSTARGVAAAVLLVLGAVDALVTARFGLPRLAWIGRRVSREIADEYRCGYHDARDAEVIEENEK